MTNHLPENFVYLSDIDSSIAVDIKYATFNNIIGRPLAGYHKNIAICSLPLAQALVQVQRQVRKQGLSLLVYESFRPQRASEDIKQWVHDLTDQRYKIDYYPKVDKQQFYSEHYFVEFSNHTRGAAVDVTLIDLITNRPLDMGTPFDFMDMLSHPDNTAISKAAYANRQLLRTVMEANGFEGVKTEWWHFNLKNQALLDIYFDFDVS